MLYHYNQILSPHAYSSNPYNQFTQTTFPEIKTQIDTETHFRELQPRNILAAYQRSVIPFTLFI